MFTLLIRSLCVLAFSSISSVIHADQLATYQDWKVQTGPNSIEAYTSGADTSFGLYCSGDECLFYLHNKLLCQPGSVSPALMSGVNAASSLVVRCTQVGGNLFQILDPFASVLETIKKGGAISFAVPLQAGTFGISSFSLNGSSEAIKRTIFEAGKRKRAPAPQTPNKPPTPGTQKPQNIFI